MIHAGQIGSMVISAIILDLKTAEVYVFCVLKHKDKATVDPVRLDQWDFYVLPTSEIDKQLGAQKTVGLERLRTLSHRRVEYGGITGAVEWATNI